MDRKIGEVFYSKILGIDIKVVRGRTCNGCIFDSANIDCCKKEYREECGECSSLRRKDMIGVIFRALSKSIYDDLRLEIYSLELEDQDEEKSLLHMIDLLEKEKENGQVDR